MPRQPIPLMLGQCFSSQVGGTGNAAIAVSLAVSYVLSSTRSIWALWAQLLAGGPSELPANKNSLLTITYTYLE